jgi:tetratricopeptide (TPR) repeat protein
MKATSADFKKRLSGIRRTAKSGKADRALVELDKMLKLWPDHPRLLVEKSRLIQLSDHGELEDVKQSLHRATEIDEDSPTPWIELGYYLLCINDQAQEAEERFEHAVELGLRQLIEAIAGKVYAILDQDDPLPARKLTDAAELLRIGQSLAERYGKSDSPEIRRLRERMSEYQSRIGHARKSGRNGRNGS